MKHPVCARQHWYRIVVRRSKTTMAVDWYGDERCSHRCLGRHRPLQTQVVEIRLVQRHAAIPAAVSPSGCEVPATDCASSLA